jgi:hypothetical protein
VTAPRKVAGNHGNDELRSSAIQAVTLDDERRTALGGVQIRVRKQNGTTSPRRFFIVDGSFSQFPVFGESLQA